MSTKSVRNAKIFLVLLTLAGLLVLAPGAFGIEALRRWQ